MVMATVASLFVGVAMYGATIFLSQYFQISRGVSPTKSGLLTMPLILGLFVSSLVSGRIITRTGRWKRFLVAGTVLVTAGMALMGLIRYDTPYWHVAIYMALIGLGIGMCMQNLVLSVQNTVQFKDLGAASSSVAFFRTLGGAAGVSVLGAILGHEVFAHVATGLARIGVPASGLGSDATTIPSLSSLPGPVRLVVQQAYGFGSADIFLVAAPIALLALRGGLLHSRGTAADEQRAGTPAGRRRTVTPD